MPIKYLFDLVSNGDVEYIKLSGGIISVRQILN